MKIFLAGATGVVGKRLIPFLISRNHQVVGTTRSPNKASQLRAVGAKPVLVDALDRDAVVRAVVAARPDAVVHQLTDLANMRDMKHFDQELAQTNRLRTEALDNLLAAAREAGARRFVAQSYSGWPNARQGGPVKTEEDPLDPNPPKFMTKTLKAISHVESSVEAASDLNGIVLRYGAFYGPGTAMAPGGLIFEAVVKRQFPLIGSGAGVWSFIHVDDVAAATTLAIEGRQSGIYNIVDDEPAAVSAWLPEFADAIGAKTPYHLPAWIGRLFIGEAGVVMMTEVRGSSNVKAKRELNWRPVYPTWRDGFRQGLSIKAAEAPMERHSQLAS